MNLDKNEKEVMSVENVTYRRKFGPTVLRTAEVSNIVVTNKRIIVTKIIGFIKPKEGPILNVINLKDIIDIKTDKWLFAHPSIVVSTNENGQINDYTFAFLKTESMKSLFNKNEKTLQKQKYDQLLEYLTKVCNKKK